MTTPRPRRRPGGAHRAVLLVATVLTPAACRTAGPPGEMGPTGLEGALPGGDGRALRAYRSEFQAHSLQAVDSLMDRVQGAWRQDEAEAFEDLFSPWTSLVTPAGRVVLDGREARAWAARALPTTRALSLWRDDFTASGDMAAVYGRYETSAGRAGAGQRGFHLTLARREGRAWRVRSQVFLTFEGAPSEAQSEAPGDAAAHITPEVIRARRGGGGRGRVQDMLAEWAVGTYWRDNSVLSRFRYHWDRDEVAELLGMLSPQAVLRVPWDVPATGLDQAARALQRFVPAVGNLYMSVLDFEASERLSFCLGRYVLEVPGDRLAGSYVAVIQDTDDGPRIRTLLFSGGGAGSTDR